MAESSKTTLQSDLAYLKETLCSQQQLLQKLYGELDFERESSATAASEALSMILRLQGEKATVTLEAEQYKRLAEEKMCHADESLAIFEDLIHQKEMEIASLYYQVQAYRYKLLSMGCVDPGLSEVKFPENLWHRNETLAGDVNLQSTIIARRNSAPPVPPKYSYSRKGGTERESSPSPEKNLIEKTTVDQTGQAVYFDGNADSEKKALNSGAGYSNSYWEQIKKLDERVKEIAGTDYSYLRSKSRSPSQFSDSAKGNVPEEGGCAGLHEFLLEKEKPIDSGRSSTVCDVFEVPRAHNDHKNSVQKAREQCANEVQSEERTEKPDLISCEAVKSYAKDEADWLKNVMLPSACHEKKPCVQSGGFSVECNMVIVPPTNVAAESQVSNSQRLINSTSEIIEIGREAVGVEAVNSKEEELTLLKEIREQLNSIQSEIRSLKTKKSSQSVDFAMLSLQEAMLHFWC